MRYRFLLIILFVSLTACTYQVQVITPEPSASLDGVATQSPTLLPVETSTSTPFPPPTTLSVLPTITSTVLPQIPGVYPIKFSPNGIYVDVVDSILSGASKTYSIAALKGQIMSVSIHQGSEGDWVYIPIQITGADGTVLCPLLANTECTFWRGALPATQNYFVKITPVNDALNFTLRVAINPPGVATQTFQYASVKQNATFSYTDEFAPARFPEAHLQKIAPEFALQFINTQFYVNTNLSEAYLSFGTSSDASIVAGCTQTSTNAENENIVGNVNINGINFTQSESDGVAAGNIYQQIFYRAANQGECYEITFFTHSGNIGNYPAGSGIKEFDHVALTQKFEAILSTLVIK